ncbi:PadR family transcriptional regulator [Nonomuraea endophytica]|uniref:PadR family transcriptional regulator n=1 Tax=Nonomuraea endophytica TaxID=714136 RepID=UPI0037C5C745
MPDDAPIATHLQELRRGTVVLACLLALERPNYGYALLDELASSGFAVEANTLYPLLRRLERQGLLVSEWSTKESRPRRFYRTSEAGAELAVVLGRDWARLDAALATLRGAPGKHVPKRQGTRGT